MQPLSQSTARHTWTLDNTPTESNGAKLQALNSSDVTKLFKIRIRWMWIRIRISTSKIRQIRMQIRMLLDKGLFYHSECNTLVYVN